MFLIANYSYWQLLVVARTKGRFTPGPKFELPFMLVSPNMEVTSQLVGLK